MCAHTSPQFPTWTFHLSSCFLGLLTIVLRDRKIPSQDTQIWKVLLLHIVRYHLHEFRGANRLPKNPQELFNHRHSSLRNVIQRSFDALKTRSPVLKAAPQIRISCPKGHSCCCVRFENGLSVVLFFAPINTLSARHQVHRANWSTSNNSNMNLSDKYIFCMSPRVPEANMSTSDNSNINLSRGSKGKRKTR